MKYLALIFAMTIAFGCKSNKQTKASSTKRDCVEGYFVATMRGKLEPNKLEYAKSKYGVTLDKVMDAKANVALYRYDTSKLTLDEALQMFDESQYAAKAECYKMAKQ